MKLTIGEKWHKVEDEFCEELTVTGLESIEDEIPTGEVVLPKDGDSYIEVRVINSVSAEFFTTKTKLKHLNENWERGEAPVEMVGMMA